MRLFRIVVLVVVVVGISALGVGWYSAGRAPGPTVTITSPDTLIGQLGTLDARIDSESRVSRLEVALQQQGQTISVLSFDAASGAASPLSDRGILTAQIGKASLPALVAGPATLSITATRPVFFGLRTAQTSVTRELQVRLEPPRVAVLSLHHFINLGGAEFVVFRATPEDVDTGIRVGGTDYRAYPGRAVGLTDPALRVAFFALRHDEDVTTPILAYARDAVGNESTTPVDHRPFDKTFLQSRIGVDQPFLDRVVPAIASSNPGLNIDTSSPEGLLKGYLSINGDLRRTNDAAISALARNSRPDMLWKDAFAQMGNSQVESRFADRRTYFFEDQEIDRQVHLGFDLASVQHAPVRASNTGVVVFADSLGIYGNCVIVDHGLGVQSLYAHLSSIGVTPGEAVTKGQDLGRTGATGLAGGDHLHFTMLLQGIPVNPVEWWDPHWMEDRVFRKIRDAGGTR